MLPTLPICGKDGIFTWVSFFTIRHHDGCFNRLVKVSCFDLKLHTVASTILRYLELSFPTVGINSLLAQGSPFVHRRPNDFWSRRITFINLTVIICRDISKPSVFGIRIISISILSACYTITIDFS